MSLPRIEEFKNDNEDSLEELKRRMHSDAHVLNHTRRTTIRQSDSTVQFISSQDESQH